MSTLTLRFYFQYFTKHPEIAMRHYLLGCRASQVAITDEAAADIALDALLALAED
jgi:hypothetical protein